jgi:hypothetical protein
LTLGEQIEQLAGHPAQEIRQWYRVLSNEDKQEVLKMALDSMTFFTSKERRCCSVTEEMKSREVDFQKIAETAESVVNAMADEKTTEELREIFELGKEAFESGKEVFNKAQAAAKVAAAMVFRILFDDEEDPNARNVATVFDGLVEDALDAM